MSYNTKFSKYGTCYKHRRILMAISTPLYQVDSAPLYQVNSAPLHLLNSAPLHLLDSVPLTQVVGLRLDKRITYGLTNVTSTGQEVHRLRLPRLTESFVRFILQSFRLTVYQRQKVQPSFRNASAKLQLNS